MQVLQRLGADAFQGQPEGRTTAERLVTLERVVALVREVSAE